jgi:Holliday junction resolvase-like predicted endonuclease
MNKKHVGTKNEMLAIAFLLDQGYEVFRNVSPHGPIDIIVRKGTEFINIDVKSVIRRVDGSLSACQLTEEQNLLKVKRVFVESNGNCLFEQTKVKEVKTRNCVVCGELFSYTRNHQKYCTRSCGLSVFGYKRK